MHFHNDVENNQTHQQTEQYTTTIPTTTSAALTPNSDRSLATTDVIDAADATDATEANDATNVTDATDATNAIVTIAATEAITTGNGNASCTATSCSNSSSDSGVILIDRKNPKPNISAGSSLYEADNIHHGYNGHLDIEKNSIVNPLNNQIIEQSSKAQKSSTKLHIENIINVSNRKSNQDGCSAKRSPTVSIRSTSISIVSIDENAIDSSVIDSDSEMEADIDPNTDSVHGNYIVKKLGQQTILPPDSPHLPNINKGLQVVGQTINSNPSPNPNGLLADNILNGGALSPITPVSSTTHQIGSIALTNSSDVTFGDKHFYEGPVTIQQFLIDSRDKAKPFDDDGIDNPVYADERKSKDDVQDNGETLAAHTFISNRRAVIVTGAIIVLTIFIGILIVAADTVFKTSIRKSKILVWDGDESRKNIPITSTIDPDESAFTFNGSLHIVTRDIWQGRPPKGPLDKLKLPVHRVIISHTASDVCNSKAVCSFRLQVIQAFHMDSWNWDDIGYNFLIGGDGMVYEGRGWDNQGAHTKGFNVDSIGISFIGTFTTIEPTNNQLKAAQLLIAEGVRLKKLVPDYRLFGARQLSGTASPGDALYRIIKTWSNWSAQI